MSKTLAIFGAGPVLGRSLARRFGREGFRVALVARTRPKLATLVAAVDEIGQIDVAEFSPRGGNTGEGIVSVLDVDPSNLQLILDQFLIPAITLVRAVLPGMIERRDGATLFTAGQSGVYPTSTANSPTPACTSAPSTSAR
jgi:NADP-dependent 3-hydroxy acid dehydrogenase YdfG